MAGQIWPARTLSWTFWLELKPRCCRRQGLPPLQTPTTCSAARETGKSREHVARLCIQIQDCFKEFMQYNGISVSLSLSLFPSRMTASDLDGFIPPAPPMQAPGLPPFEGSSWGREYPQEGRCYIVKCQGISVLQIKFLSDHQTASEILFHHTFLTLELIPKASP